MVVIKYVLHKQEDGNSDLQNQQPASNSSVRRQRWECLEQAAGEISPTDELWVCLRDAASKNKVEE